MLEDVVLWMAFGGGVLGAVSFFWQVYNYYAEQEVSGRRTVNAQVLRPWSEVKIVHRWSPGRANDIDLVVPKEALPAGVVPTTGEGGLSMYELPGLDRGISFLRDRYPTVYKLWQIVQGLTNHYSSLLGDRHLLLEPMIRRQMEEAFPRLAPARNSWTEKDTYVLDNLIAFVESRGWRVAVEVHREAAGPLQIHRTPTQSGETMYFELRGNEYGTLVHTQDESVADIEAMKKVITSCLEHPDVTRLNKEIVECFAELEEAVDSFRTSLRDVAVAVDVAGR